MARKKIDWSKSKLLTERNIKVTDKFCVGCKWFEYTGDFSSEVCMNPRLVKKITDPVTGYSYVFGASCTNQRDGWKFLRPFLGNKCGPDGFFFEKKEK